MIPEKILHLLNGQALKSKINEAFLLATVDQNGIPHMSMISVGEVVSMNQSKVRLALWPNATTAANLLRNGGATLSIIYSGVPYYLKLRTEALPDLNHVNYPRKRFEATVLSVKEDKSSYAKITSGITINLKEPEEVLHRWRETINELVK